MHGLKRVGWTMGQPLLPHHFLLLEDSVLSHAFRFQKNLGLCGYGLSNLRWDEQLLRQGVLSLSLLTAVFPSGHLIDLSDNAGISPFELNKIGKTKVTLYLHLLKQKEIKDCPLKEEEQVVSFSFYQLLLSEERSVEQGESSLKFGEFEKEVGGQWHLSQSYIPPLLEAFSTPFLRQHLSRIQTLVANFQEKLVPTFSSLNNEQSYTYKTKFCIKEIAELRRTLINMERGAIFHPYFLYQALCQFLDGALLMYRDQIQLELIAYQHDQLGPLFDLIIEKIESLLEFKVEEISSIPFEKEGDSHFYVMNQFPKEMRDAQEIYLVIQAQKSSEAHLLEGIKLASRSRLPIVLRHALKGIEILRRDQVPFNNNFAKDAHIYAIKRDSEWILALNENRLAFTNQNIRLDLQGFLYWRH
jgi:type VI secretion system protein ImpJ